MDKILSFIAFIVVVYIILGSIIAKRKGNKKISRDFKPRGISSKSENITRVGFNPQDTSQRQLSKSFIQSEGNGWVLNQSSTFPLTLYGITRNLANEIKNILDNGMIKGTYEVVDELLPLFTRYNIRCKEVDEYVLRFKRQYLRCIEELKKASNEWETASELDREDLLAEFREEAIQSLDMRPDCDLEILFEGEPEDITVDDVLIDKFGFKEIKQYLEHADKFNKVWVITAGHYNRACFENLVELGLAKRSSDITTNDIIKALRLKDLNNITRDLVEKPFRVKQKAIDFLNNRSDARERIGKVIAFREMFQIKPLPNEFSHIDLNKVSAAWRYADQITEIIVRTYTSASYTTRDKSRSSEYDSFVKGWRVLACEDVSACPYCKREAKTKYPKNQFPKIPFHLSCRCTVIAETKYD